MRLVVIYIATYLFCFVSCVVWLLCFCVCVCVCFCFLFVLLFVSVLFCFVLLFVVLFLSVLFCLFFVLFILAVVGTIKRRLTATSHNRGGCWQRPLKFWSLQHGLDAIKHLAETLLLARFSILFAHVDTVKRWNEKSKTSILYSETQCVLEPKYDNDNDDDVDGCWWWCWWC